MALLVDKGKIDASKLKFRKINYQINILPSMSQKSGSLIDAIANSDELEIFHTDVIMDMVEFKWKQFALGQHKVGCFFNFLYMVGITIYIQHTYIDNLHQHKKRLHGHFG